MPFNYSKDNLTGFQKKLQRFFEIVPGFLSWSVLLGVLALSFINSIAASIFAIAFLLYWLMRISYLMIFLVFSYFRLNIENGTDWMKRVRGIDSLDSYISELKESNKKVSLSEKFSTLIHKRELEILKKSASSSPHSNEIYHVVIIPVAKESEEIIRPGVEALSKQTFLAKQILVAFAVEERAPDDTKKAIEKMKQEYKDTFFDFLFVIHPAGLPGEARVKAANASYTGEKVSKYLEEKQIPFENVTVSCFDADTVVHDKYFACLTYYFMVNPDRTRASYQPIPVYHNNIWQVPSFSRVMETGSSFFQLIESTNTEKLVTFSSHSMSFKALKEVGYWPRSMISDDSAIFWKAYLYYGGNYRVIPMYVTLSMDANSAATVRQTAINIYKQRRRWAYGAENFPIVMRGFLATRKISLYNKIRHAFKLLEDNISWATWGFLITTLSWLPAVLSNRQFRHTIIYYTEPRIAGTIFRLSTISLLISIILSIALLPKKKIRHSILRKIKHAVEWLSIPVILLLLNTLPALDAQTRLMFGKYMEFWVTDKARKHSS